MERVAGGGLRPAREARVDVREALLGQASGALAVQLLGGAHRGGERRVHGEAELREGEEVVLFLTRSGGRSWRACWSRRPRGRSGRPRCWRRSW